ncbi:hypothetical protein [Streptomyces sp. NPDC049555]|uniref:hypothetical protein n=1 Tax=Streptomyces sp. NPDC049555 TaxID=3154930 RepID=UPI0034446630
MSEQTADGPVTGQDWTTMNRAAFDIQAPNELPVPASARIMASPDRYGTPALFGDEPPPPRTDPKKPARHEGQEELF